MIWNSNSCSLHTGNNINTQSLYLSLFFSLSPLTMNSIYLSVSQCFQFVEPIIRHFTAYINIYCSLSIFLSSPLPESLDIYFHFYKTYPSSLSISNIFSLYPSFSFPHPLPSWFLSLSSSLYQPFLYYSYFSLISFITLSTEPISSRFTAFLCHSQLLYWIAYWQKKES